MTTLKAIDKRIATVATMGTKFNGYIHDTAVMIAETALATGNCTRALTLVNAMPASMRRTMLIAWFAEYTPIAVKLGKDEAVGFTARYNALKDANAKAKAWKIEAGKLDPFYAMAEKEPEAKEYTLVQLIAMVQQVSKRIKDKKSEGKIAANDLDKVDGLLAKIDAIAA